MRRSRRDVLRYLLTTPLAATLDYERLLWVPTTQIVVPALRTRITLEEINRLTLAIILPQVTDTFFAASPLVDYLRSAR